MRGSGRTVGSSAMFVAEVDGWVIRLISGRVTLIVERDVLSKNIQQSALVTAPTSAQGATMPFQRGGLE